MTLDGKGRRAKGQRGERATVHELQAALGDRYVVRRGHQSRSGRDEPDVVIEGFPRALWIEVKNLGSRPSWGQQLAALKQAEDAALTSPYPRALPIVVIRESRRPPMAVLRFTTLCDLINDEPCIVKGPATSLPWEYVLDWIEYDTFDAIDTLEPIGA